MKKRILSSVFIITALVMTACGNDDDENAKESTENKEVESQEVMSPMDDMKERLGQLSYTTIDFDVLYSDSEFEGEIQEEDGLIEAEFFDPFNSVDARGADAFDAMFPIVSELEINSDMTDEEAVSASIKGFDLPEDFLKAELQITFSDGTEKTFKVTNSEL